MMKNNNKKNLSQGLQGQAIVALVKQAVESSYWAHPRSFDPSLDLVDKQPEVREADDDVADLKTRKWDFPGGPVAKISCSQCRTLRFNPWLKNQIPHDAAERLYAANKDPEHSNEDWRSGVQELGPSAAK